jgi:hypothetical protein
MLYEIETCLNLKLKMINLFSLLSPVLNDAPEPWQIGFQDGASPAFEGITELHSSIFFYLVVILIGVVWMMGSVMVNFHVNSSPIVYKYANHGTLIELIWTISPAFILIAIAFPSFKLLYLMDSPVEVLGIILVQLSVVPVSPKRIKKLKAMSASTSLVEAGNLGSSVGFGRLTQYIIASTKFPKTIVSQLVGHLLGDGGLVMSWSSVNPYFVFTQTLKRFDVIWGVFDTLAPYCNTLPKLMISRSKGGFYPFMQVHTRSYPFLNTLHELFYQKVNGKYVKSLDFTLIFPYLDNIALAHWAMDDGAKAQKGFYLHTKGFTFMEVYKLVAMLHYLFQLECTVQNHDGMPVISISYKSMPHFVSLVRPHFHAHMLYKLP